MAPMTPRAASQTIVDLRSKLAAAEASLPALENAFQEAALADLSGDDAGAAEAAREAVQEAQTQIAKLQAAIPAAERQEAQVLAAAQAEIRAQHVTKLTKELKELETQAIRYSCGVENAVKAWRRLTRTADAITELLQKGFPELCTPTLGYVGAMGMLTPGPLQRQALTEIARLGLHPILSPARRWNFPASDYANVDLRFHQMPHELPAMPEEIKALASDILGLAKGDGAVAETPSSANPSGSTLTGTGLPDTTEAGEVQPEPLETVLEPDTTLWAKAETLVAQQMAELMAAGKELPKQLDTGEDL
jgi:hypothetical protein